MDTPKQTHTFTGPLCTWQLDPDVKARIWTVLNIPFRQVEDYFYLKVYEDKERNKGFPRLQTPSHIKTLWEGMVGNNYTPACWAGGVEKSHAKAIKIDKKEGTVSITVATNAQLPLIDGGHRDKALIKEIEALREQIAASKDAKEKAKLEVRLEMARNTTVTLQLFLDPDLLQTDFVNLQLGRPPDRDMIRSIQGKADLLGETKGPLDTFAKAVAKALDKDKNSFLFTRVKFDANGTGRPLHYASIASFNTSEYATTLMGGAKLATAAMPERSVQWLISAYNAVYSAIHDYGVHVDNEPDLPELFRPEYVLTPIGAMNGGTKGGTAMLIGLGNVLSYRMIALGHETATEEDLRVLVEIAEDLFNHRHTGQSANDKRTNMCNFTRRYCADLKRRDNSPDFEGVAMHEGIPIPLCEVLSYSTFGVSDPKKGRRGRKAATPVLVET